LRDTPPRYPKRISTAVTTTLQSFRRMTTQAPAGKLASPTAPQLTEQAAETTIPSYFRNTSGRKWLVCIDGSNESRLGLYHALSLMSPGGDTLVLVHAAKKHRSYFSHRRAENTPGEPEPEPDSIKRGRGYLTHATNLIKQWGEDIKFNSTLVTARDPREALCDLATEEKADYIVMGSRGPHPIKEMFLGSVTSYVSSHAPCPVIVIRETSAQRRERVDASLEEKKTQRSKSYETHSNEPTKPVSPTAPPVQEQGAVVVPIPVK